MKIRKTFWVLVFITLICAGCDDDTRGLKFNEDGTDSDSDNGGDTSNNTRAELVGDIERSGNYVLEMTDGTDTILFECTAAQGGLITKAAFNGKNILAEGVSMNGSTFWLAPQSAWGWPPPAFLDKNDFTPSVEHSSSTIILTSAADPSYNIQVIKKFSPDLSHFAIVLEYSIVNTGSAPVSYAPWEISRVLPGGITFFPSGSEVNSVDMTQMTVSDINGVTWFDHTTDLSGGDYKYCADGARGWLAHTAADIVFVKSFEDQPSSLKPSGQGEIQLYVKGGAYEEVEQMGAYTEIPPGEQVSWTVRWYLRKMPADASMTVGDQPLVDYIDNLVK